MDEITTTLMSINAVLEEHARQIQTLVAANRALDEKHQAQIERHQAQVDEVKAECREKCESLERRCGVLEARCGSLERSIQVLKKDVDWTYKAPDIPRSHWIEQGHDEAYADNMEEFLESIKEDVENIRADAAECSFDCLHNGGHPAMLHDDALLPHLRELADAIQVSSGTKGDIYIENVELHPLVIKQLFPAMEGKVIDVCMESILFSAENVAECYEIIAASIRNHDTLQTLAWVNNRIPTDEQADLLIQSVIDNRSIKRLDLYNCFNQRGANGCRALATLITCERPFESLVYHRNGLSGIDDVAAALATNPQLEALRITNNNLNNSDAELIAQSLKQNTNLQVLFLRGNNITSTGFEKIGTAIYDPSSLNGMESCNHTCYVDCFEQHDNCVGGNFRGMTSQQRRHRKLFTMLSTRQAEGSNARHLNAELGDGAFATRLVPRVLECIGRWSVNRSADKPTPLSLYFEIMKSWNMPELYEHCGKERVVGILILLMTQMRPNEINLVILNDLTNGTGRMKARLPRISRSFPGSGQFNVVGHHARNVKKRPGAASGRAGTQMSGGTRVRCFGDHVRTTTRRPSLRPATPNAPVRGRYDDSVPLCSFAQPCNPLFSLSLLTPSSEGDAPPLGEVGET
ncbi:hypothetical protein THAOC_34160 [Thalassiosira oceanica]|uniref:Uncharacterized protein n=1 Tax=Thalassiosira oceanica TaxID=159749 RepID=K0R3X9_THAOC|nr:hypothetical protein THAOC_34160 [Thalassiosira oceanica]|eukprot:EJK47145.1 hypothetical protein THAOC_34160 [Thalassiosira oceanica]